MNYRIKDITGQRFGNLTAVQLVDTHPTEQVTIWSFQCACGNLVERRATSVKQSVAKGLRPSCQKCWVPPNRLEEGRADRNSVVTNYKASAERRNLEWCLSDLYTDYLFESDCHYCGESPSNSINKTSSHGKFIYNGIDRVDSKAGYVPSNVVTSCAKCNYAKGTMDYFEFIGWIYSVSSYLELV